MPPRKSRKARRPYKPRKYGKRRYKKRNQLMTADRSGYTATKLTSKFPLAKTFKRVLPYYDSGYSINPAIGTTGAHTFRANSMYDFDGSGGGHQPLGFDQLMLMYEHFTVIGFQCKIDIRSKDNTYNQIVGAYLSSDPFPETDIRKILENGDTVWQIIGPSGSGIESVCSLTLKCNIEKFLGITAIMSDDSMRGSASADPTNGVYLHVIACPFDQSSDVAGIEFGMYANFVGVFTEPKELDLS